MTIPSEALKKCRVCGENKPLTDYYLHSSKKYLVNTCKPCVIEQNRVRRNGPNKEAYHERENAWHRNKRARIREQVFAGYGGYKCVCCGETEPKFMTLDHINNDGGEFRKRVLGKRTMAGYHTYVWLIKNNYPPVVQVMCMNCQHGKLMNNGTCPHKERVTTSREA